MGAWAARQMQRVGRSDQGQDRRDHARRWRPLVLPRHAPDPPLPQERARGEVASVLAPPVSRSVILRHERQRASKDERPPLHPSGPSPFEAAASRRHLRVTVIERVPASQCSGKRCGCKMPSAVTKTPASVSKPEIQASATIPVMMVADASTMAIWKAAEPSSKWWYLAVARS